MRLFLNTHLSSSLSVDVDGCDDVAALKEKIRGVTGIAKSALCLSYSGAPLLDDATLDDIGIEDYSHIDVNCELVGGGKKRKKKTYNTPKKIKHKRKKVKLATLKYYKVCW